MPIYQTTSRSPSRALTLETRTAVAWLQVRKLVSGRKAQDEELERLREEGERLRSRVEEGRRENRLLTEAKDRVEVKIGELQAQVLGLNEHKEALEKDLDESRTAHTVRASGLVGGGYLKSGFGAHGRQAGEVVHAVTLRPTSIVDLTGGGVVWCRAHRSWWSGCRRC